MEARRRRGGLCRQGGQGRSLSWACARSPVGCDPCTDRRRGRGGRRRRRRCFSCCRQVRAAGMCVCGAWTAPRELRRSPARSGPPGRTPERASPCARSPRHKFRDRGQASPPSFTPGPSRLRSPLPPIPGPAPGRRTVFRARSRRLRHARGGRLGSPRPGNAGVPTEMILEVDIFCNVVECNQSVPGWFPAGGPVNPGCARVLRPRPAMARGPAKPPASAHGSDGPLARGFAGLRDMVTGALPESAARPAWLCQRRAERKAAERLRRGKANEPGVLCHCLP